MKIEITQPTFAGGKLRAAGEKLEVETREAAYLLAVGKAVKTNAEHVEEAQSAEPMRWVEMKVSDRWVSGRAVAIGEKLEVPKADARYLAAMGYATEIEAASETAEKSKPKPAEKSKAEKQA